MTTDNRSHTAYWLGIIVALVGLCMLPFSASADTIYFCNASVGQGGNGSATAPWACADDVQLEAVLNTICTNGGGTLYRSLDDSFVTYEIQPVENGACTVQSAASPDQPPTAGGESLLPLILMGAAVIGVVALAVGVALRWRPTRA